MFDSKMIGEKNTSSFVFRTVLVGDSGVGKSSLLLRYLRNKFQVTMNSTTGIDFEYAKKKINANLIKLELWDTSGQQRYFSTCSNTVKSAKIAILVYDMTNLESLKDLQIRWLPFIEQKILEDGFLVFYGNKQDLLSQKDNYSQQNKVIQDKILQLKQKFPEKIRGDFKGSCKDAENPGINNMMDFLFQHCYDIFVVEVKKKEKQSNIRPTRPDSFVLQNPQPINANNSTNQSQNQINTANSRWRCF